MGLLHRYDATNDQLRNYFFVVMTVVNIYHYIKYFNLKINRKLYIGTIKCIGDLIFKQN